MPLGKRSDFGDAKYAGLDVAFKSKVEEALDVSLNHPIFSIGFLPRNSPVFF